MEVFSWENDLDMVNFPAMFDYWREFYFEQYKFGANQPYKWGHDVDMMCEFSSA